MNINIKVSRLLL